jgi:endonuclease YncB( thermonuclease family)
LHRITATLALVCVLVLLVGGSEAAAQEVAPAVVTGVVDGGTVDAQLADGRALRVRLIGIDTPERGECGTDQATAYMEQLALGRNVTLVSDPTQGATDRFGRSLFYIDRDDGLDVGLEMVRSGWAEVFLVGSDFQRVSAYLDAEDEAARIDRGVWTRCDGDFHFSRADELRERRFSAVDFMGRYYRRVSNRQFQTAWGMLGRRVRRELGPFRRWKAGHRRSLGASVLSARARLSGRRAVVSIRLRARDRDACSGRIVHQYFRGRWILTPQRDSWIAVRVRMQKTRGGEVRLSKSECAPRPAPPRSPPPVNCQGYSPCIRPGPDVDCAGGSGNGPRYVNGPVYVRGDDPYGLDADGDGVACE